MSNLFSAFFARVPRGGDVGGKLRKRHVFVAMVLALISWQVTGATELVPVGSEILVNTSINRAAPGFDQQSSVAMDPSGSFVIVWESFPGVNADLSADVFGQRFDSTGATVGSEFLVNTTTLGTQNFGGNRQANRVAADANGNFVVVWASVGDVTAQRFDSAGAPVGGEIPVATAGTLMQETVAMDANGNFVVAWTECSVTGCAVGSNIQARRYDSTGTALGVEFQVNTSTVDKQILPDVAMAPNGDLVVVWATQNAVNAISNFRAQLYSSAGAAVGGELDLTPSGTFRTEHAVAMDGNGNFVLSWTGLDAQGTGIFGRRYNSTGAAVGSEFQVNTGFIASQNFSQVAVDADGNFVIAYASDVGDGSTGFTGAIMAQSFDSSGTAVGSEFLVNTTIANRQDAAAVAMTTNGKVIISWDDASTDRDVRAQLYGPADQDGDGFSPPDDCNEGDPDINPDAVELPGNFVDENCDGNLGDCDPCGNPATGLDWKNHGQYVRCVAHAVEDLVNAGDLTEEEGDTLVTSAAMSDIGKNNFVPPECQ